MLILSVMVNASCLMDVSHSVTLSFGCVSLSLLCGVAVIVLFVVVVVAVCIVHDDC